MTRQEAAQKPRPSRQDGEYCKIGSIRIPAALKAELMEESKCLGLSLSDVVRGALEFESLRYAVFAGEVYDGPLGGHAFRGRFATKDEAVEAAAGARGRYVCARFCHVLDLVTGEVVADNEQI